MTLKLIQAPSVEPVSLLDAKAHLRCGDDEDALISGLIQAARQQAEHETGRALGLQVWEQVLDAFPEAEVSLGLSPVVAVSSVKYVDATGTEQTIAPDGYSLDNESRYQAFVFPALGTSWPATLDTANAVRIRFTAGYDSGSPELAGIKSWMLLRIGTLYKVREQFVTGTSMTEIAGSFVDRLLDPYRVWRA